jgi:maleylpyruvate isomerase
VDAALRGESAARYPGGKEQREREIEQGAGRPAAELIADVTTSARRLDELWVRAEEAGWPDDDRPGGDTWPVSEAAPRRLREVEVHHVDLGLDYTPADWTDFYVQWELSPQSRTMAALPGRLASPEDARRFLAWLIDRGEQPDLRLRQWD